MRVWKIFTDILTAVLIVILVAIMAFNITCYVKRQNGEIAPTVFGVGVAVVVSGSMEPEIMIDDLVVYCRQSSYEVGEVVTYEGRTVPVSHRIIGERVDEEGNLWYTTKGDFNDNDDGEIAAERVVGEVVLVIPKVGKLQDWIQSGEGFLVLALVMAVLILLSEIQRAILRRIG